MKFKSKKDPLFSSSILGICIFIIGLATASLISGEKDKTDIGVFIFVLVIAGLLLWLNYGTYYEVSKTALRYVCGPIRGSIELDRIREIHKETTVWGGFRPATARKGLLIKYDAYEEIYISPEDNDAFIKYVTFLKEDILVTK